MASSFPTSLDSLSNPGSATALDAAGFEHDVQHANLNDAVEALEAKVGINASAVQTSLDYLLRNPTRHGWRLTKNAAQTGWLTATWIDVTWQTEAEDTDAYHTGTNAIITIPTGLGGVYVMSGMVQLGYNNNTSTYESRMQYEIANNPIGATMDVTAGYGALTGGGTGFGSASVVALAAGSTVKLKVYQATGSTQQLHQYGCEFSGYRVSA